MDVDDQPAAPGSSAAPGPAADPTAGPPVSAVRTRQAGLAFARRANRWLIAGAVAFAGALTALTAHAFHPHTSAAATQPTATPAPQSDDSGAGLTTPQSAPQPTTPSVAPPVVSGGS